MAMAMAIMAMAVILQHVALLSFVFLFTSVDCQPPTPILSFNGVQQVWKGNDRWFEKYSGYASIEYNADLTADSRYRVGSNSKLITNIAIFQLGK
jgi:hypothetical protein